MPAFSLRSRSPDGAATDCAWWQHLVAAYYSFIDPERMKGWVDLVSWPIADGCRPSAVGRAQDSESSPVKDQRSTAEPNVTAHPWTASVPTSYYSMWHSKGLNRRGSVAVLTLEVIAASVVVCAGDDSVSLVAKRRWCRVRFRHLRRRQRIYCRSVATLRRSCSAVRTHAARWVPHPLQRHTRATLI